MTDEEDFDVGRDLPAFLASVLDKAEHICQNDVGEGAADAHAEVINQSIRMLRSIRDCRGIGVSDKEELDSDHVLTFLLRCWKNCVNWDSVGLRLEKCWVFQGGRFTGE